MSISAICQIIDLQIESKCSKLSPEESKIVRKEYIASQLKSVADKIQNVRQIEKIIEEYIGMQLVEYMLSEKEQKSQEGI